MSAPAMLNNQTVHVAVLIVGAGPSGATTALLLGRLGISSLVISRHPGTATTPRAHIFNQRAMEVLRDAGIEGKALKVATSSKDMLHTSWSRSLAGEEYGRLYAWGNDPKRKGDYEMASPCAMTDVPQSVLEPILVEEASQVGAEFRFGIEFLSQETIPDGRIKTTVRDRSSGELYHVLSTYLIGCDGARSAVLDSIGIPIDGKQLNTAFNVHIMADLSKYMTSRPGSLNWILNPDAPGWSAVGNFRMVRPWNEWVVSMHPALRDGEAQFEPSNAEILTRLYQMIGDDTIPITILSSFRWTINDQTARTWQKGNIICIGDATHRHPPINGLGSNTCISDAFNIAWKLAYVLKKHASPSILETITSERKPVGDGIVRRANEGMLDHRELWKVIGLSKEEQDKFLFQRRQASVEGRETRRRLHEAIEKTDDEVQALGIQMNQVYIKSALTKPDEDDFAPDFSKINSIKEMMISTYPGYHLPHVWLVPKGHRERVSTLDVAGHGVFTLFTGIGGHRWKAAAEDITKKNGVTLKAISIGYGQDYSDVYRDWEKLRGVDDDGAVLVRPDHFVCWRCKVSPENLNERLKAVMGSILNIEI